MNVDYTIGIAAKNEEKTIRTMLSSLDRDIRTEPVLGTLETIICTNGTTDNTAEMIDRCTTEYPLLNIKKISSNPGKVSAQQAIISNSDSKADFVIFYDADITIHKGTTKKFIEHFESVDSTKAATGDQVPYNKNGLIYRILNIEAIHPEISVPERKYLIGRCMGIRKKDYFVPETIFGEDMFLSNYLVDKYGPNAVKRIPDALISYTGPQSLKDYFFKTRRYTLDKEAMYNEYPEFKKLKSWFKRSINPEFKKKLSTADKMYLSIHDIIKYLSVKFAHLSTKDRWVTLTTTKEAVTKEAV